MYSEQILQSHVNQAGAKGVDMLVVEDGVSVHFKAVAAPMRTIVDIPGLSHPPSSPDPNPIEGCWRILKQGLRGTDRPLTCVNAL